MTFYFFNYLKLIYYKNIIYEILISNLIIFKFNFFNYLKLIYYKNNMTF